MSGLAVRGTRWPPLAARVLRGTVDEPPWSHCGRFESARSRPERGNGIEIPGDEIGGRLVVDAPSPKVRPGFLGTSFDRESDGLETRPSLSELLPGERDRVIWARVVVHRDLEVHGKLAKAVEAHLETQPRRVGRARGASSEVECRCIHDGELRDDPGALRLR